MIHTNALKDILSTEKSYVTIDGIVIDPETPVETMKSLIRASVDGHGKIFDRATGKWDRKYDRFASNRPLTKKEAGS